MDLIDSSAPFCFNYVDFGQDTGLFVRAAIYDVSSGVAVFDSNVVMSSVGVGLYSGNFTGSSGKTYLVISLVYTDGTYATPNPDRAPNARVFQVLGTDTTFMAFFFPAFNQLTTLPVASTIYDLSTGSPVQVGSTTAMAHVANGVYFGSYTGDINHTYQILEAVYTDGTFTSLDGFYAPGSDAFQCFQASPGVSIDPGVENVLEGIHYEINGTSLIGTLHIKESIDPGVGNVVFGVAYEIDDIPKVGTFSSFVANVYVSATLDGYNMNALLTGSSTDGTLAGANLDATLVRINDEEKLSGFNLNATLGE